METHIVHFQRWTKLYTKVCDGCKRYDESLRHFRYFLPDTGQTMCSRRCTKKVIADSIPDIIWASSIELMTITLDSDPNEE